MIINGEMRSNEKPRTVNAQEGYCNEATHRRPSTHSPTYQTQNITKNTELKQRMAWPREEIVYTKNSCNTKYCMNIVCFRYMIINALHKDDDDNVKLDNKHW